MDAKGYYQKYNVTRKDGKPVGRTFTIEIDKDPLAHDLLWAIIDVYSWQGDPVRDSLVEDLQRICADIGRVDARAEYRAMPESRTSGDKL